MSTTRLQHGYEIAGYRIDGFIGAGAKGHVYRAFKNNQQYALKVLSETQSNADTEALNFHRETAVVARLKHPSIARVYDFGQEGSVRYIAMEFTDGVTLQQRLQQDGLMDLGESIRIAIAVTSALQEVHNFGYVHRDIKPENIVLCQNGEIKLIDFGLAGSMEDPTLASAPAEAIGTFDYAAPEQSGVRQQAVDGRSDLYSIGVVLYQCVTGVLPFVSQDLSELLLMHAQKKPVSARDLHPAVSVVLERIIEKLLEKDPEDRYQSASGLVFDLQNLRNLENTWIEKKTLILASQDLSVSGAIRLPLFGREPELKVLRQHLQHALLGRGSCVVIEGEGGLGKSRLARELILDAISSGVPVLTAKCSSLERDVPYALFKQALDQYLHQIKQMPEALRLKHENYLRESAKNNTSTMLRLNSGLQVILGKREIQDSALDLEAFAMGVRNFFLDLAELHQGLVLHLDDIQWIDSGSLAILKSISDIIQSKKLLIQVTARNDEASLRALDQFVQSLNSTGLDRLKLKALDLAMTAEIAKSFLGGHDVAPEISEKLFTFSNGNPFVLTENISRLISSGCLRLMDGKWQMDQLEFAKVGLSENVYDLVLHRIGKLGPKIQSTLQFAAVIGYNFDLPTLSTVLNVTELELKDQLKTALRSNVIEMPEPGRYRFLHDRIREALTSTLSAESVRSLNDQLADVLSALPTLSESQTYELARFMTLGNADRNPTRTFQALLKAGQLAKASNASQQAYDYFQQASTFENSARLERELLLQYWMDCAAMCIELGHLASAHGLLDRALKAAKNSLEKAQILNLRSQALAHLAPYKECWDSDMEVLRQIGQDLPETPVRGFLSAAKYVLQHVWISVPFLKPAMSENFKSKCLLSAQIYERMTITGYFTGRKVIMLPIGIRFLFYARLLGTNIYLVRAHGYLGQVASILGKRRWMNFHLRQSSQVAEAMGNKVAVLLSAVTEAIARERIGDDQVAEEMYVKSMPDIEKYLSTMNFGIAWGGLGLFYYMRGRTQESIALVQRNLPRTDRMNRLGGMVTMRFMLYHQYLILGQQHEADQVYNFIVENIQKLGAKNSYAWMNLRATEFIRPYELGQLPADIDQKIEEFQKDAFDTLHFYLYFIYIGYIRQLQYEMAVTEPERQQAFNLLGQQLKLLKKYLKVPIGKCHYWILQSAYLRMQHKFTEADKALRWADTFAEKAGSLYARFMLLKEKSRLAMDQKQNFEVQVYARMAYELALRQSWPQRAEQVAKEFALDTSYLGLPQPVSEIPAEAPEEVDQEARIASSLLRISLVSSLEMNSKKQIQFSLDEIVQVMGAERSYVFLWDDTDQSLKFAGGRNSDKTDLEEPTGYSSTVVSKVAETQQSLIVMGDDQMEALGSKSAVIHGLRSIIASPLVLKGELKGVVYVDSSVSKVLFTNKDTELLSAIASHIAIAFENLRMMNVEATKREMQKDLELSAAIQTMLFPKNTEVRTAGLQISGWNRPAAQCGGDWWWHEMTNATTMQIFVGDVTGHGAGPAMITSFLAACFKMARQISKNLKMPDLLSVISRLIFELANEDYLVSAIAVEMNIESRKLSCWNCGANGLYLIRKDGTIENFGEAGTMLGNSDLFIKPVELTLNPGDRIFIPTDGLSEQALPDGRTFGDRRVLKLLEKTKTMSPDQCLSVIAKDLDDLRQSVAQQDDITMIYFEVLG